MEALHIGLMVACTVGTLWLLALAPARILLKAGMRRPRLRGAYRLLRKSHGVVAVGTVISTWLHCRVAFHVAEVRSGIGVALLACLVVCCLTGLCKRWLKRWWLPLHRLASALLVALLLWHVLFEF